MTRNWIVITGVCALLACARPTPPVSDVPRGVKTIAVPEPINRTSEMLVSDPGLIVQWLGAERVTVPQRMAVDLRGELERLGFEVVDATDEDVPALRVDIRSWRPYSADYSMVQVDLAAALVAPGGERLWATERPNWVVPTRDAHSTLDASAMACEVIAEELLRGWKPPGAP